MAAKWKFGFLCDGAMQVHGKWTYQGVFGEINAVSFPAVHPEAVLAFRFNGPIGPHVLCIQLTDSIGKPMAQPARAPIECQEFKDNEVVITVKPLTLPAPGYYSFKMSLDDETAPFGSVEFQANKIQLPQPPKLGG